MTINKRQKVIWILLPSLGIGGAEIFLTSLAAELKNDYRIIFFINNKKIDIAGVKSEVRTHSNTFGFVIRLLICAWRTPPDTILSSIVDINVISLILKGLMPRKIKHIIREALPVDAACNLTRMPKIYRCLAHHLYPSADAIINLSEELRKNLEEKIPGIKQHTKSIVIPNGVRKERMKLLPVKKYSTKTKTQKIVAIGRLEYQKGFDNLISAFSQFSPRDHEYELIIVGEGSQRQKLQKLINGSPKKANIHLIGAIEDPISELYTASFFALSSRYEGLSNAMLEALVNGIPVLATKQSTSAGDIIDENNGVLVAQCTVDEILKGLIEMDEKIDWFSHESIALSARKNFSIGSSKIAFSSLFESI